ncbi:MAG: hypothetical protein QE487_13815 [Fluviicola sp.]|nr:hypothetical protein [Fluviicola sp.]
MKKVNYVLLAIVFPLVVSCGSEETAEKKVDLTEEGFDLQGALELFEKSKSPEDFERALNAESNPVNNLDLNDDGKIDFVKVIDRMKDKSHSIALQVVLNEKENQDIAAIVIEKSGPSSARLQIIGNEVLYGKEVVLEPIDKSGDSEPKAMLLASNAVVTVNVWTWPIIQHVYQEEYVPYVSPVRWEVYPVWYEPHQHHHKKHGKGHAYGHYKHHHDDERYREVAVSDLVIAREIYISNRTNSATISIQFRRDFPNFRYEDGHYHGEHYDKHHDKHFDKHHDDHPGNGNGHQDKDWNRGNEGDKHDKGKSDHDGFKGGDKHDKGPKHEMKFNPPNNQSSHEKGGDHGNGGNGGGKSDHGNGGGKSDKGGNGGGPGKGGGKKK